MEMENIVQAKKCILQDALKKIISLKYLINRNKEIMSQSSLSKDEIFRIPFVVLFLGENTVDSVLLQFF